MRDWSLTLLIISLVAGTIAVIAGLAMFDKPVRCGFNPTQDITAYETSIILMYSLHEDCAGLKQQYPEIWQKYMRDIP